MGSGWLKALELKGPQAFLAFIASALVSYGHQAGIYSLGQLPTWAAAGANVAAVLFGVLAVPWLLSLAFWPFRAARRWVRNRVRWLRHLHTLLDDEKFIFWGMVASRQRQTYAYIGYGGSAAHRGLYERGLLTAQANVGEGTVLIIPDHVWEIVHNQEEEARRVVDEVQARAAARGIPLEHW